MDLFEKLLANAIRQEQAAFYNRPGERDRLARAFENESFQALQKIRGAVWDPTLTDFECLERIVCILGELEGEE